MTQGFDIGKAILAKASIGKLFIQLVVCVFVAEIVFLKAHLMIFLLDEYIPQGNTRYNF